MIHQLGIEIEVTGIARVVSVRWLRKWVNQIVTAIMTESVLATTHALVVEIAMRVVNLVQVSRSTTGRSKIEMLVAVICLSKLV